ncbi:hypothetical protein OE88DRAFT_1663343 [Heliocybe sulcata]|uniref:Uncharacterized protein n=1 Tax=Heliocybe sulcata TaxID=5364 RepID=A0A5C3N5G5_9AGAM|nr:hypothetical protein OE88DRAFT_1663343 [Heliocybe sulcata]
MALSLLRDNILGLWLVTLLYGIHLVLFLASTYTILAPSGATSSSPPSSSSPAPPPRWCAPSSPWISRARFPFGRLSRCGWGWGRGGEEGWRRQRWTRKSYWTRRTLQT